MGNGLKYTVPRFQRDYSWDQEQWHDLWLDARSLQTESEPHYMGYLVFESEDNRNFTVIDGQQRLATISILILAAMDCLEGLAKKGIDPDHNRERLKALRGSFIGFKDPVSLEPQNKITLNRNNEAYFRDYLCLLKPLPQRNVKASERLMGRAFEHFKQQFEGEAFPDGAGHSAAAGAAGASGRPSAGAGGGGSRKGQAIARFVESLADGLVFTAITVGDEAKAYTIFETLSARGVQLSAPDLVKNCIFSIMAPHQQANERLLAQLEDRWGEITKQLGRHKFSDFIRADWNSRTPLARKKDLFKKIKAGINSKEKADKYLDSLRESAEIHAALKDPHDEFWRTCQNGRYNKPGLACGLKTLDLFHIANPQSALIAAFRKFEADKFIKFLSYVEAMAVRCHVIGNPGHQEEIYSKIVQTIISPKGSLEKIRGILKGIYPSDEAFLSSFKKRAFKIRKTEKQIRYILTRIENHLSGRPAANGLTLEHILPKNPSPEWQAAFEGEDMEDCPGLIGNMTLLPAADNKDMGRLGFGKKKDVYRKSDLKITRQIAGYDKWDRESILSRQKWLGEQAARLWRIPFD